MTRQWQFASSLVFAMEDGYNSKRLSAFATLRSGCRFSFVTCLRCGQQSFSSVRLVHKIVLFPHNIPEDLEQVSNRYARRKDATE